MRIQVFILSLLLCVASSFAKDVITKTDGTKLDAKVEEITETIIKYRKASNLNGPVYTIPISSVATVLYENGDVDNFNVPGPMSDDAAQSTALSDEELMQLADSQPSDYQSEYVSDADLLKMYNSGYELSQSKVKTYRTIGWIGAGTIFVGLTSLGIILMDAHAYAEGGITLGCGILGSAGWFLIFNNKANSLMKKARQMQSYSMTLIENEIFQFGNNLLSTGINVMGNRMTNSHSLGVSLGLSF